MWLAYYTAAFHRAKELPDFESLIADKSEKVKPQTPKQLEQMAKKLARLGVGEILEPVK